MIVEIKSRYGDLSRGKCWGRQGSGSSAKWAPKRGGILQLTPGMWTVGSDDGFNRKDRGEVTVHEDGSVTGLPRGWSVIA